MKRLFLFLLLLLLTGCVRMAPRRAMVLPSPTPEMLIVRPTRVIPTPEVAPIVMTLTAMNIRETIPTGTPKPFEPVVIGNLMLEYLGNSVKTSYDGEKYVEINYRFTNNSTETISFGAGFSISAFQDGTEMKVHGLLDDEEWTDIRPGNSIIVKDAYYLRNNSQVIELEFYPFLRTWEKPVYRTITIK